MTADELRTEAMRWLRIAAEDLELAEELLGGEEPRVRHCCWLFDSISKDFERQASPGE